MSLPPNSLVSPHGSIIRFQGAPLESGTQPAVLFFALSAQASLFEDPFNQSVVHLNQQGIRVFSWDLPFHETHRHPQAALEQWAHALVHQPSFLFDFFSLCQANIDYLIQQKFICPSRLGVAGLSRGGWIATHLAARDTRIKTLLGFAPLTHFEPLEELKAFQHPSLDQLALISLVDRLTHLSLRFYIGNRDKRVGTDACYSFVRALTETIFNQGIHSPPVEMVLYPSIGYKGHGTPPAIFQQGADWMRRHLIKES